MATSQRTRSLERLVSHLLKYVYVFDEIYTSTDRDELGAWWAAENAIKETTTIERNNRNLLWRELLEDMRSGSSLFQAVGECGWDEIARTQFIGSASPWTGGRTRAMDRKRDYVLCATRETRDHLRRAHDDLQAALSHLRYDHRDDEAWVEEISNFRPIFVVRTEEPEQQAVPQEQVEAEVPSEVPEKWTELYKLVRSMGVHEGDILAILRRHDGWRIKMLAREVMLRYRCEGLRRMDGPFVAALSILDNLTWEDQLKAEVLFEHGFRVDRALVFETLRPEADDKLSLERVLELCEHGKRAEDKRGHDGSRRYNLGRWMRSALTFNDGLGYEYGDKPRAEETRQQAEAMAERRRASRMADRRRHQGETVARSTRASNAVAITTTEVADARKERRVEEEALLQKLRVEKQERETEEKAAPSSSMEVPDVPDPEEWGLSQDDLRMVDALMDLTPKESRDKVMAFVRATENKQLLAHNIKTAPLANNIRSYFGLIKSMTETGRRIHESRKSVLKVRKRRSGGFSSAAELVGEVEPSTAAAPCGYEVDTKKASAWKGVYQQLRGEFPEDTLWMGALEAAYVGSADGVDYLKLNMFLQRALRDGITAPGIKPASRSHAERRVREVARRHGMNIEFVSRVEV